jgi:hypothetical protein
LASGAAPRDATYVLDGILDNETELDIIEHTTDTIGYTDLVFALFDLLGLQFSPRIHDLGAQRFYRLGPVDAYPNFGLFIKGGINRQLIIERWDDLLRVAASLKLGWVTSSLSSPGTPSTSPTRCASSARKATRSTTTRSPTCRRPCTPTSTSTEVQVRRRPPTGRAAPAASSADGGDPLTLFSVPLPRGPHPARTRPPAPCADLVFEIVAASTAPRRRPAAQARLPALAPERSSAPAAGDIARHLVAFMSRSPAQ